MNWRPVGRRWARGLLDIFASEWPNDREMMELRGDIGELHDELARGVELAALLDQAEADIAAKRLRAPRRRTLGTSSTERKH